MGYQHQDHNDADGEYRGPGYEWNAVTLLGLGFGLVGLDRWIIAPLFPFMVKDLHFNYEDLGLTIGILGLSWGLFTIIGGGFSDRIGRRKILIPAIVLFSLLSGFTGLITGLVSLLIIRAVIGVTEGAFMPVSVAATHEASHPKRRGLNQGLQLSTFALFGLGLAPIIATQLLRVVPSWRWVFLISMVPGLLLAVWAFFVIREPRHLEPKNIKREKIRWREIFAERNVVIGMLCMACVMTGIFILCAMVPSYLSNYIKLSPQSMGLVTSALGFGGFVGNFAVPAISDIFGRRPIAILAFIISAVFIFVFSRVGANPWTLFLTLLPASFCCFGLLGLFAGPIPTEAVAPTLVSSSIGIVAGTGDIFSGALMTPLAGHIAQHSGIQYTLYVALAGVVIGVVASLFLEETAPRKLAAGRNLTTDTSEPLTRP